MFKIGLNLFLIFFSLASSAYTVFSLKKIDWDRTKTVDVYVVGEGREMGNQFLFAAITRARHHMSIFPKSRAQIILWANEKSSRQDIKTLKDRGFYVDFNNKRPLNSYSLEYYLKQIPTISSLHIFSHNSAFYGSAIQKGGKKIDDARIDWIGLRENFTKDSFVFLHGCNTGFLFAPELSELLEKPVFGSLSSTDFQEVFKDGQWYHNNKGQYPKNMSKMSYNKTLFEKREKCWKGFCHRMKANNHPYTGYWGKYKIGLPFYKAFCNFRLGRYKRRECMSGIAMAIQSWPHKSDESINDKIVDMLCPTNPGKGTRPLCRKYLSGKSISKRIFWGKTLSCNLKGCDFTTHKIPYEEGTIGAFDGKNAGNQPIRDEYNLYLEALDYL